MSLARFLDQSHALLRAEPGLPVERALEFTRDRWQGEGRYEALVSATLGNWTAGNCVAFMQPLSEALLRADQPLLHRKLWVRTIKRQVDGLFRCYSLTRAPRPSFEALMAAQTGDFDAADWSAYDDNEKAAAFLLQDLVRSLDLWRQGLARAQRDTGEVEHIAACVRSLRKPRLDARASAAPYAAGALHGG